MLQTANLLAELWVWLPKSMRLSYRVFSPDCTLHTAITHVISVLERWKLTHDHAIGIHVRLHHSNTFIMCTSDHRVQCAIRTKNPETTVLINI